MARGVERVGHARLPHRHRAPPDRQVTADAHLPAEHHVVVALSVLPAMPTCAASSTLRPIGHAVADLHEVVDLRARLDARFADRGTIDRRVGAQLHVVFDDDRGDLRDLLVRAVAAADEAVAIAADDHAVLQHHAIADASHARGSRRWNE